MESIFMRRKHREMVRQKVKQAIEKHSSYDIEVPFITAKGKKIWVRTIGQIQVVDGKAVRLYGAIQNITEYKEAALKLQNSEERYKLLAENTNDLITLNDKHLNYLYVSPSIKILRGYEPDELVGKNLVDNIHPEDTSVVTSASFMNKLESGLSNLVIYRFKLNNGNYRWFESNFQPVMDDKNELVKIVKISRDISERIEREQAIENYQKSLKNLTIKISLIEEKQRKEIAANIHDHLSQLLVISKMKLTDIQKDTSNPKILDELKAVIKYISEALENTRKITYDLSPPILYELGLIETMHWLAEKTEKEHHIKTTFTSDVNELQISESKLILIFRMIQELVNNMH